MKTLLATLTGLAILAGSAPALAARDSLFEHQIRQTQQKGEAKPAIEKQNLRSLRLRHPKMA